MRATFDALGPMLPGLAGAALGDADDEPEPRRLRTVFISDLHLGTPGCQAAALLDFLKAHPSDYLYLVGDIVDGWQLRRRWYWPQAHNDVVQKLLRSARKGCRVIYVPGNHDEFARQFVNHRFGGVEVVHEAVHVGADGRQLWVIHGDHFDGVVQCAKWLAYLGDNLYEFTLRLNRHLNSLRARLGLPYWSLSAYLKHKVKKALNYVTDFEAAVAHEAGAAATTAWSAAISTAPRCATSAACCIATTATGSRAARRWWSTTMAGWNSCNGSRPTAATAPPARRTWNRSTHEDRAGDRCLATSSQRRGHHARGIVQGARGGGACGGGDRAGAVPHPAVPGLRWHRPGHLAGGAAAREAGRIRTRRDPPGHGRTARMGGPRVLPQAQAGVHDGVPHQVPGDPECRGEGAGVLGVRPVPAFPQAFVRRDGPHARRVAHAGNPGLSQPAFLDPRRGHGAVSVPPRARSIPRWATWLGPWRCSSGAFPTRRTSTPF